MARITRAAPHLEAEEVKTRLKLDPRPLYRQRWMIIYNALVDPREASDIAKHTGTTVAMVHQVIASYNRLGVAAVETTGKGGRRRQYLTWEEEQAFLAPFFNRAERGEIATAGEIQRAFEAQVGHEVNKSTISRLLKRHHWRKPAPRPVHPKASAEAQAQFKKTSRAPLRLLSRPAQQMTSDLS
jgi:transposase